MLKPLYQAFAMTLDAYQRCMVRYGDKAWTDRHLSTIIELQKYLPQGAGFDKGTVLKVQDSTPEHLVFKTSFHHMDDLGCYSGWTEHEVIVTPSLIYDIKIDIRGENRDNIHELIGDTFSYSLDQKVTI